MAISAHKQGHSFQLVKGRLFSKTIYFHNSKFGLKLAISSNAKLLAFFSNCWNIKAQQC